MLDDNERRQWASLADNLQSTASVMDQIIRLLGNRGAVDDIKDIMSIYQEMQMLSIKVNAQNQLYEAAAENEYQEKAAQYLYECASCKETMIYIGPPAEVKTCHDATMVLKRIDPPMYPRRKW